MCICVYSPPKCSLFCVVLCAKGVRKDRIRVIKRDKRRPGNSGRERSSKDVEQKTAPHQDRRKHLSRSGDSSEGGKCAVPGIPPDQVPDSLLKRIQFGNINCMEAKRIILRCYPHGKCFYRSEPINRMFFGCFVRYSSSSRVQSPHCCALVRS